MKKFILWLAGVLAFVWRIVPRILRHRLIEGLMILESRGCSPEQGLRDLFRIEDKLTRVQNERALALGGGIHPKHALVNYAQFFIDRINGPYRVLDVGCSYGEVARKIAAACPNAQIVGIEILPERTERACALSTAYPNLSFVTGDATVSVPDGPWEVIVLSNVLEHITDRVGFLHALQSTTQAGRYLIRVPMFERGWGMPMRRALGINYYSDPDHKIEHTVAEFRDEMAAAGLVIEHLETPWGEIWAQLRPI